MPLPFVVSATAQSTTPEPGGHPRDVGVSTLVAIKGAVPRLKRHDVQSLAAGVAFKIFLSIFPAAVAAVAIFSLVGDPARLLARIEVVLPAEVATLLEERVLAVAETQGAGLLALVGVLGGFWAASSAAATLMKALNRINGVDEQRSFISQRLTAFVLILALFGALGGLLALVVLGPQLRDLILPPQLLGGFAEPLFSLLQLIGALVILILLFAFVYWIGPNRERPEWHWWSPGALVGVFGWLVMSGGFTLYTQTAANYEATYSGLAGVIVTLLWLQLSMLVLLFGAEVNAERGRLLELEELLAEGVGQPFAEPTTEVLRSTAPREGLPAPETVGRDPVRSRALVAAVAGVAVAAAAIVGSRRGRG